jgi:hypothetical protein
MFSGRDLRRRMRAAGFTWLKAWGIHAFTNLIPSTTLHRMPIRRAIGPLYQMLRRIDTALSETWLARATGNNLIVLAERDEALSAPR